ncbi:HAD family hydrolase [Streptomyces specialis]|uniref:HAD family hydrolase n=1 Tax=Streptomyces specialis TaxID=498367 RepID=UPI00073EC479|nr:HAD family phosphatase [Streptomyces specialis]
MYPEVSAYGAVIADWDGTLVDSQPLNFKCLAAALEPHGVVLRQDWYRQRLGVSGEDLLRELDVRADARMILEDCGELIMRDVASLRTYPLIVGWIERAREAGLRCAVASGGGGSVVRAGLAATGLVGLFDVVVTREDAPRGKPAPDLFLEAARRLAIPPIRCLVIEDADEGIDAARAAGMDVVDVRPFVESSW